MRSWLLSGVAGPLACLASAASAQTAPTDLKDFGLICFCTSRVATPHRLVEMDNNGRILSLLRRPMTKAEIAAAGLPVLDSQLRVLVDWGLVSRNGDRFHTAFPVLAPAEMAALRQRLDPAADSLARAIEPDVAAIVAELQDRGAAASTEAVLFAYVFDGLVWRELERRGRLPSQKIVAEHPFWAGTFWAVYPKQDHMPGTNNLEVGKADLRMMWTPAVVQQFSALANDEALKSWLGSLNAPPQSSAVQAPPIKGLLVIDERTDDPIVASGRRISHNTVESLVNLRLDDVIAGASESQRLLIATHELLWLLLDRARQRFGFRQAAVGKTGGQLSDLGPLLVAVVKSDRP